MGGSIKFLASFLFISLLSTAGFARDNDMTEIQERDFPQFRLEDLKSKTGVVVRASAFSNAEDPETQLIKHKIIFKLPVEFKKFTEKSLKSRASVQTYLMHDSEMTLDSESTLDCPETNGVLASAVDIPKFLSAFDFPEKLICNVKLKNVGTGKKNLSTDILQKLPDLKDEDIRFVDMSLRGCNMIFKKMSQKIFFIKIAEGQTLIVFDNNSYVKKATLEKLEKVKLFTGTPVKFINEQVRKNSTGLLKHMNSVSLN